MASAVFRERGTGLSVYTNIVCSQILASELLLLVIGSVSRCTARPFYSPRSTVRKEYTYGIDKRRYIIMLP